MDSGITIQQPLTLRGFCEAIVSKYSGNWPPNEETIAEEFLSFFQTGGILQLQDLERLCGRLGVNVSVRELPKGLRGYNCAYGDKREILVGKVEGPGSVLGSHEHTLFHELRELIEYEFRKVGQPVATVSDLESRAEAFARTVRAYASIMGWAPLLEGIGYIESKWGQFAAFLILFAVIAVQAFSCFALPFWEDRLPK